MTDNDHDLAEFEKRVDRVHRATSGADDAPDDLWQRVVSQANSQSKERSDMSNIAVFASAVDTAGIRASTNQRGGFRHYVNLAATIVIVAAVALAGWFAIMQLNQPGSPDRHLALMNSTPLVEPSSMCEVEPLTVDTVMEIVRNPARFMAEGPTGEPRDTPMEGSPPNAELWEVDADLELISGKSTPTREQFDDASVVANEYLNCIMYGTQGQIWTFYSPVLLQQKILGEFPVFAEESQVRQRVEELSSQPAYLAEYAWEMEFNRDIESLSVNPDYQLAIMQESNSPYYEYVISIGVSIADVEGNQIILTNGVGRDLIPQGPSTIIFLNIAKVRSGEIWLIIPWPSEKEIGW